jgi:hypothetical protein
VNKLMSQIAAAMIGAQHFGTLDQQFEEAEGRRHSKLRLKGPRRVAGSKLLNRFEKAIKSPPPRGF